MDNRPAAVIFTHSLLEKSNTFIKNHAEALQKFRPVYAGAHRVDGIRLPEHRTYAVNNGSPLGVVGEAVFRRVGWAPMLVRQLKKHSPRIVHAHFGTSGPAGMALANALQIPLVVTFHGQDATMDAPEAYKTYRGRELLRNKHRLIAGTNVFIAVSQYIKERLLDQGYPEDKVLLHYNGINLEYFNPDASIARTRTIVFVGRFVEKKGTQYLIEAAEILRSQNVDFELVLIGSGPLETELRDAANRTGTPCRFMGFLTAEEVRSWLGKASVVAVPSVVAADGDCEGLPTIVLEAQAMRAPIVATRHSGIPEGVRAGATAELVAERDAVALAQQLRSFLDCPAKVEAFGRAGRRFVEDRFDLRHQVEGLETIYTSLQY